MDPSLARRRIPRLVLFLSALDAVELVLRPEHFVFAEQLVLGADRHRDDRQVLDDDPGALRDQLTLENSVDADAARVAERDWFGPRETFFEEDVLEVGPHEGVLNRVAVVVKSLHQVVSPALAQFEGTPEKYLVELHQKKDHLRADVSELY